MESAIARNKSSTMLAPGFRFHPTDEELVRYYLRRKVCGKGFRFDAISEIDVYKVEPWDLPSFSKLKSRDLEWYFFSVLDKKYGNGARTNRATEKGYWKTTGKDRAVYHKSQIVGMKKTLVYHSGRAPKGLRSNWVMHEYRLVDLELERAGIAQDAYVLCRVFQKSGSGPKNGEQYGAPFVEEEWEDDELELVPKVEAESGDDKYLDDHDLEQNLGLDVPSGSSLPLNLHSTDGSYGQGTSESVNDTPKLIVSAGEQYCEPEQNIRVVKREYIGESSKFENPDYLDYLLDEPYFDASDNLVHGNGGFIESSDQSNPMETKPSAFDMLEEHHTFLDDNDDCTQHFGYDISAMLRSDDAISHQVSLPLKELNDETEESALPGEQPSDINNKNNAASTSTSDMLDSAIYEPEFQYPFSKQTSHMLCPSKDAALRIGSLSQPSSSVHVTAGMIQIRNLTTTGGARNQPLHKPQQFKILLSFSFSRGDNGSVHLESNVSILPRKTNVNVSRGLFYLALYCAVILYMSFKIGSCISAK